ncbi:hypothetical protein BHE90_008309 [Fusarium euwallaceae]|uniref:Uncharacterized protein n=1 Tax=Fusarium euwallaceae TaxID=1147111 RepID=A0A430LNB2_9HYPO|nr:hypothetical protein BHE90_008309 [Fusarium euwallaceae]
MFIVDDTSSDSRMDNKAAEKAGADKQKIQKGPKNFCERLAIHGGRGDDRARSALERVSEASAELSKHSDTGAKSQPEFVPLIAPGTLWDETYTCVCSGHSGWQIDTGLSFLEV